MASTVWKGCMYANPKYLTVWLLATYLPPVIIPNNPGSS